MILVTGGTGNVGRALVRELRDEGAEFVAMSRNASRAADCLPAGTPIVQADFDDLNSLRAALGGVDSAFLVSSAGPEQAEREARFVGVARAAGVSRVAKVSGARRGNPEADALSDCVVGGHARVEDQLAESGMAVTILRPAMFMQNLFWFAPVIARGRLPMIGVDFATSCIDARDVAAVAARVLVDGGHGGMTYSLTGPSVITYRQIAAALTEALGHRVEAVDLSFEQMRTELREQGFAPLAADLMAAVFDCGVAATEITNTVQTLTGCSPRTFLQFARDHAAAFRAQRVALG